jgi:hypothetical protein
MPDCGPAMVTPTHAHPPLPSATIVSLAAA